MSAVETLLDALRNHGFEPKRNGKGHKCRCPAHDDRTPSLSIDVAENGKVLLYCHAGCAPEAIVGELGLMMADLFERTNGHANGEPRGRAKRPKPNVSAMVYPRWEEAVAELERRHGPRTASWTYEDAESKAAMIVSRFPLPSDPEGHGEKPNKTFRPVGRVDGGWIIADPPGPLPLYRLPELLKVPKGSRLWVFEGERCADVARSIGLSTTTSAHGSQAADKSDWSHTRGLDVVVSVDHDEAGERYGADVVRLAMAAGAKSVRIVRLVDLWPGMPEGGDIADYIAEMDSREGEEIRAGIEALADKAAPVKVAPERPPGPRSLGQLWREFPHPRPSVVEGLLRDGQVATIVAESKVGKTMLMMDLALAVATGRAWLGRFPTVKGDVLYVDNELQEEETSDRLKAIVSARRVHPDEVAERIEVCNLRGWSIDIKALGNYFDEWLRPGRFKLCIFDALYKFIPEGMDENDNADVTTIYNHVFQYARKFMVPIIVVHHASKGGQSGKSVVDVGAGAGAASRSADCHAVFRAHEEDGVVVFEARPRSFGHPEPFCIRWTYPVWNAADGLDPKALRGRKRLSGRAASLQPPSEPWTEERFVREFVRAEPTDQKLIKARAHAAGLGIRQTDDLLMLALAGGTAHRWVFAGNTVYLATKPQPVTAPDTSDKDDGALTHTRARTPHTPRGQQKLPRVGSRACAQERERKPRKSRGGTP